MKVNRLPARTLTPNSYAIEGGGPACRNGPVLRNWTECHHTARCARRAALFGAKGAYTEVLLRFASADFMTGVIYNATNLYAFLFRTNLQLMDATSTPNQEGRAEFHI